MQLNKVYAVKTVDRVVAELGFGLARFPFSRDLASFDFAAQP